MNSSIRFSFCLMMVYCLSLTLFADEPISVEKAGGETANVEIDQKLIKRLSIKQAQDRAKLLHNVYSSTLDVMHHHYFREDRSAIPARVMVDIFAELEEKESIKAGWISVNAKPMSIDHKPADEFEKQAAKVLATGKEEYELIENGVYRRAGAISLMNRGCLGCHLGFGVSAKKDRFAGLVITIPILEE
jgi:hypothetical protein